MMGTTGRQTKRRANHETTRSVDQRTRGPDDHHGTRGQVAGVYKAGRRSIRGNSSLHLPYSMRKSGNNMSYSLTS